VIAALLAFAIALPCSAARVYQLVNYPPDQDGYSLAGTITTTDQAPLDSILDVAEILDWQWSAAGPIPVVASRNDHVLDETVASGLRITNSTIELPLATPAHPQLAQLRLAKSASVPRGSVGHRLIWSTRYDAVAGTTTSFSASTAHGDVLRGYWFGPSTGAGPTSWLIATAVPEPSGLGTVALSVAAVALVTRRFPSKPGGVI
jgi:hypothetical protein